MPGLLVRKESEDFSVEPHRRILALRYEFPLDDLLAWVSGAGSASERKSRRVTLTDFEVNQAIREVLISGVLPDVVEGLNRLLTVPVPEVVAKLPPGASQMKDYLIERGKAGWWYRFSAEVDWLRLAPVNMERCVATYWSGDELPHPLFGRVLERSLAAAAPQRSAELTLPDHLAYDFRRWLSPALQRVVDSLLGQGGQLLSSVVDTRSMLGRCPGLSPEEHIGPSGCSGELPRVMVEEQLETLRDDLREAKRQLAGKPSAEAVALYRLCDQLYEQEMRLEHELARLQQLERIALNDMRQEMEDRKRRLSITMRFQPLIRWTAQF